ncbi:MAG: ATP-binding cassette domain-containing protein [Acidobacteriota bacterium]
MLASQTVNDLALQCHDLVKQFKDTRAVDRLSMEVPKGVIFGLLGPNGSGKTTTIRMALGVFPPDSGSVQILDSRDPLAVRTRVGYLPEERGLYAKMKVIEQLAFLGTIRGLTPAEATRRAAHWLERLGLGDRRNSLTNELSKGNQQKVQFASAILHEPALIVLDEPSSGLDPVNARLLNDLILEQKKRGATVMLSTHRMEEVEAMCDAICLIHKGKPVLSGRLSDIKSAYGKSSVVLEYDGAPGSLDGLPGVSNVRDSGRSAHLRLEPSADSQALLRALVERVRIRGFRLEEPHVEDIFFEKVGEIPRTAAQQEIER